MPVRVQRSRFTATTAGPTLWVATTGNDTTGNGSQGNPYATPQKAADVATAGTTVWVQDGTYPSWTVDTNAGTALARIAFRSVNKWGAKVNHTGSTGNCLYVDQDYIDIIDWDFTAPATNIAVYTDANHCRTIGCYVHDVQTSGTVRAGAGINHEGFVGGNYLGTGCAVIGCRVINVGQAGNNLCHPIYMAGPNGLVYNNLVFNTRGWGIHCYHGPNGGRVMNNLVVDCDENGGILIGDGPEIHTDDFFVGNNILVQCGDGVSEAGSGIEGTEYRNNRFWDCVNDYDNWTSGNQFDTSTGDPLFVSYNVNGAGDYHLQSGSGCRNGGTATFAPSTDYDGMSRPQGAGMDIGPYEMA